MAHLVIAEGIGGRWHVRVDEFHVVEPRHHVLQQQLAHLATRRLEPVGDLCKKRERKSLVLAKIELRSGFSRESIGEKRRSDWEDGGRCGVIEKDF